MKGLAYELWFQIALFSKARDVCTLSELCTDSAPLCNDEILFSKLLWRDFQLVGGKELYVLLRRFIVSLKRKQNKFSYSVFITSSDFNNICGYKLVPMSIFTIEGNFRPVTGVFQRKARLTTINLMSSWKTVHVNDIGCRYSVEERGPLFGKIVFIHSGLCMWNNTEYVVILTMERIVKYASKKINS
jgi:hypothetical protein